LNRIKILPDIVSKKIAAGEVVEGPFSVIKELIENSADAGSDRIEIQITDSGLKKIIIKDNGSGIHRDDIKLALVEHATSKIEDVYDIETVTSYGFRGEALSSISSISDMTILSRRPEDETGSRLTNMNGIIEITDYAGSSGTTVIAENLFYNVPARKKFLKARSTELKYIRETILKTALVLPDITFTLDSDGKRQFTLSKTDTVSQRIEQIYGKKVAGNLYHEKLQDLKVNISGFLSKPDFLKSTRSMQQLYINNRPVEGKYMGYQLTRAYEAVAPKGKHPAAIIFIEVSPELLDVNIHPAKREVKLFDQRYIDSLIYHLAKKAMSREHSVNINPGTAPVKSSEIKIEDIDETPELRFENNQPAHLAPLKTDYPGIQSNQNIQSVYKERNHTENDINQIVKDMSHAFKDISNQNTNEDIKIIGTVLNTYIIAEENDTIHFIDFHAAHERFIFDTLSTDVYSSEKQELMFPAVIELPINDYRIVIDNLSLFQELGFDIEDFSDNTVTVRAVPVVAGKLDAEKIIKDFTESIQQEKEDSFSIKKEILATVACHSAKRAGDRLTADDMRRLVNEAFSGLHELRCPHGRPFMFRMTRNELGRMFKRQ